MYTRYVELRDKFGYSDADVSKLTKIPPSTFTDWKNNRSKPKIEKLIKLANLFECTVDELIKQED